MKTRITTLSLAFALLLSACVSAFAAGAEQSVESTGARSSEKAIKSEKLPRESETIIINAPVEVVWNAIKAHRSSDARRKLLSYDGKIAVIKELFEEVPVVGAAECTYTETEDAPLKQISYRMVNSNRFRTFEGCYTLEPGTMQNTTKVTLTAKVDPGIRFPFWQDVAKSSTQRDLKATLASISEIATRKSTK